LIQISFNPLVFELAFSLTRKIRWLLLSSMCEFFEISFFSQRPDTGEIFYLAGKRLNYDTSMGKEIPDCLRNTSKTHTAG
jgi:hypothetical protein